MDSPERLYRLGPTAEQYSISPRTLRQWANRRLVPCYRPTKRLLLFKLSEVDAALSRFRTGGRG
jgi:hypothetical protein